MALSGEEIRRRLQSFCDDVDDGAYTDLRDLHRDLDRAAEAAYGWPAEVAADPAASNARLLELNRQIAAGEIGYAPFDADATEA